jgi:hypothetical protein
MSAVTAGAGQQRPDPDPSDTAEQRSRSLFSRRLGKFRRLKRGYYSFVVIAIAYFVSFFLPLLANNVPVAIRYQGRYSFPIVSYHPPSDFGVTTFGEPDYRALKAQFEREAQGNPTRSHRTNRCSTFPELRPTRRPRAIRSEPMTAAAMCSSGWHTDSTSR